MLFQSTLPQGKWPYIREHISVEVPFQSTLPQGKWHNGETTRYYFSEFQSTLPQGKWLSYWTKRWRSMQISIHTSAREVTAPVPFLHWKKLISIHTSAREVTDPIGYSPRSDRISIHTSAREVTMVISERSQTLGISIHTSAREVTVNVVPAGDGFIFQSTLPQGKWRGQDGYAGSFGKFQSTLPQGKWRNINLCKCSRWGISIHTSAREVTRSLETRTGRTNFNPHFRKGSDSIYRTISNWWNRFQSTLPQGKWLSCRCLCRLYGIFQSTLPQGKWLDTAVDKLIHFHISIHTSAREVTTGAKSLMDCKSISIHTSAREVTKDSAISTEEFKFQSTLPQGKWRYDMDELESQLLFQSTLPQGKWPQALLLTDPGTISIHTSAREVTTCSVPDQWNLEISIHTSAREVTRPDL